MTFAEATKVLESISTEGFGIPIVMTLDQRFGEWCLTLQMLTDDRETGKPTRISSQHHLAPHGCIAMEPEFFAGAVRRFLQTLVLHELDEWLKVDGVRKWDPHPNKVRP